MRPIEANESLRACPIPASEAAAVPLDDRPEALEETRTVGVGHVTWRATERDSFTEYHITGSVDGPGSVAEAADEILAQVAEILAKHGVQPIQEKIYGRHAVSEDVLRRREGIYREAGVDPSMPVTWVEGVPLQGCDFVGLQIWGIRPHGGEMAVTTVANRGTGRGRLWQGRGFRMLHIPFVRGLTFDGTLRDGDAAQAEQMFINAGHALHSHGLTYRHVVRTWIYMGRLLEWYDDFNRVRTACYSAAGLGAEGGPAFPASTGIQCRHHDEECMMDLLAIDVQTPGAIATSPIRRSSRQDLSFNYGSAFSRGAAIEIEGRKTVHISGTASIDSAGRSVHVGDAEMQSLETLMCIAAILEDQGGSLANITSATLFCKDVQSWQAWQRVSRLLGVPDFPKVVIRADVCRHDLLVEMEAVAVI